MFKADVELIWHNCQTYNAKESVIVSHAKDLKREFNTMRKQVELHGIPFLIVPKEKASASDEESNVHASPAQEEAWTMEESSVSSKEDTGGEHDSSNEDASSDTSQTRTSQRNQRKTRRHSMQSESPKIRRLRSSRTSAVPQSQIEDSSSDEQVSVKERVTAPKSRKAYESSSSDNSSFSSDDAISSKRSTEKQQTSDESVTQTMAPQPPNEVNVPMQQEIKTELSQLDTTKEEMNTGYASVASSSSSYFSSSLDSDSSDGL